MGFTPANPEFERRTRDSFGGQGAKMAGRRVHCATGTQTLMALVGRAGVKD